MALDLELDDDLRQAGLAREAIRVIQEARKASGFDIGDRVTLTWSASESMSDAIHAHQTEIADEVLATTVIEAEVDAEFADADLGLAFSLAKV